MQNDEHQKYSKVEYRLKSESRKLETLTYNQLEIAQKVLKNKKQPTTENKLQLEAVNYMLKYKSDSDIRELIKINENDVQTRIKRFKSKENAEFKADLILNWLSKVGKLKKVKIFKHNTKNG